MVLPIVLAFLAGVTRTVGRMTNAQLSAEVGLFQSTFFNYLLGLICALVALPMNGEPVALGRLFTAEIPLWAYWGGAIGVCFIALSNLTAPKMSAFAMTLLIFVGQIVAGLAIDFYLLHALPLGKVVGGALIFLGLLCNRSVAAQRPHPSIDAERSLA